MNSNNYQYVSIDTISNRITKHPLLKNLNYEDILDYTVDVLRLVNIPTTYEEHSCYRNIVDYKISLPEESVGIKSLDYVDAGNLVPMITSTYGRQNHLEKVPTVHDSGKYTYTLNGGMAHTNIKSGVAFIIYDRLKCDGNGLPMIPDNVPLIKAIENYIKVQVFSVMVDLGKIPNNALQRAEQEYNWYIGKAQTAFQGFDNDDDTETFLSNFKRMFDLNNTHRFRDRYNSNKELRYKNK